MKELLMDNLVNYHGLQGEGLAPATDGKQFIKTQVIVAVNLETKTFSIVEFINPEL